MKPVKGMAFVIEDVEDGLTEGARAMGLVSTSETRVGTSGVVYAVNDSPRKCRSCGKHEIEEIGVKKGDKILYSKFVAEQVYLKDDQGKVIERLKSVPTESILAILE